MEALAYLCEQGGDPTIICKQGRTPKVIAAEDECQIAAALLGIYTYTRTYTIIM